MWPERPGTRDFIIIRVHGYLVKCLSHKELLGKAGGGWGLVKTKEAERPSRYNVKVFPVKKDRGPNNDTAPDLALGSGNLYTWPKRPRNTHFSWKAGDWASATGIFQC